MHVVLKDLYYEIDFSMAAFFIDLILYFYVKLNYSDISYSNKVYKRLVYAAAVVSFLNILGSILLSYYDKVPQPVVYIVNALFYIAFLCLSFVFASYIESYTNPDRKEKIKNTFNLALLFGGFALIVALVFTGNVVVATPDGVVYKPYRYLLFIVPLYYVLDSIFVFVGSRIEVKKDTLIRTVSIGVVATILVLLQALFATNVLISDFIISVTLLVFFFTLESPDYFELENTKKELEKLGNELEIEVERQTRRAEDRLKKYDRLVEQMMITLAKAIDARDSDTNGHSFRVAKVSGLLAEKMGMNATECLNMYRAGLLHDIGKIGVKDKVLYNEGDLSEKEYEEAKEHTGIGGEILKTIEEIPELSTAAKYHHERYDGTGYPYGLRGKGIPLAARIVSIADSYDAMVAERRYGTPKSQAEARKEIELGKGTQFDPKIADKMLEIIDEDVNFRLNGDEYSSVYTEPFGIQ